MKSHMCVSEAGGCGVARGGAEWGSTFHDGFLIEVFLEGFEEGADFLGAA